MYRFMLDSSLGRDCCNFEGERQWWRPQDSAYCSRKDHAAARGNESGPDTSNRLEGRLSPAPSHTTGRAVRHPTVRQSWKTGHFMPSFLIPLLFTKATLSAPLVLSDLILPSQVQPMSVFCFPRIASLRHERDELIDVWSFPALLLVLWPLLTSPGSARRLRRTCRRTLG